MGFIKQNEELFAKLYEVVLWPIIYPLAANFEQNITEQLKEEIWHFFITKLQQKSAREIHKRIQKIISSDDKGKVDEFILGLVGDFTETFFEEMFHADNPTTTCEAIQQLIDQQLILKWVENIVERTFSPLLFFAIEKQSKITDLLQIITRIILVTIQDKIELQEAIAQLSMYINYNYKLKDELVGFIKSFVQSTVKFKEKYGMAELAKIAEIDLKTTGTMPTTHRMKIKLTTDTILDRERVIDEWKKNILEPSCIGIKIAGDEAYNNFIEKCTNNFELFLDQTLTSDDFDKRLDNQLKSFGGDDEELIEPIRDTISNSIRFLEIARIDDPSLSFLLLLLDDERATSKRFFI
ncbi:MAG: hypothetical protein ACFFDW_03715 [Candidatus Thorarchaeota archaeon]